MAIPDGEYIQGGEKAGEKVLTWLHKKCPLDNEDTEQGFVVRLKQIVSATSDSYRAIDHWDLDFGDSHEDLVGLIIEKAEEDAENHRGKVRYAVMVDGKEMVVKFTLTVPKTKDEDGSDYDDWEDEYDPTAPGVVRMSLKHSEVSFKEMNKNNSRYVASLERQLEKRDQRIADLEEREHRVAKTVANLHDAQHIRDYEWKKLEKEDERRDKTVEMFTSIGKAVAPVLTTKLMGGGQAAAAEMMNRTPVETIIEGFFESLTDEQKMKIGSMLNPAQQYSLQQVVTYMAERRQKEEEMKKEAPSPTNPFGAGSSPFSPPNGSVSSPPNAGPKSTHSPFTNIKL